MFTRRQLMKASAFTGAAALVGSGSPHALGAALPGGTHHLDRQSRI